MNTLREREHGSAAGRERREMQVDLNVGAQVTTGAEVCPKGQVNARHRDEP
jgi:hypothetical protein